MVVRDFIAGTLTVAAITLFALTRGSGSTSAPPRLPDSVPMVIAPPETDAGAHGPEEEGETATAAVPELREPPETKVVEAKEETPSVEPQTDPPEAESLDEPSREAPKPPKRPVEAAKQKKPAATSTPKWVFDIRSNVRAVVDIGQLKAEDVSALIGDEAVLVTEAALYRITPCTAERIVTPPAGLCMYLPRRCRPAWLLARLRSACAGNDADVRVLLNQATRSELSRTILTEIQSEEAFNTTAYQVTVLLDPGLAEGRFKVAAVERRPLQERGKTTAESQQTDPSGA